MFVKGLSLFQSGKTQEAFAAYNRAIELDPTFAAPWNGKGYVLGAEGRYREALAAYDRAIALDPALAYAWNGKGYMLGAEGRYRDALDAYRTAIELNPSFAYPWAGVGNALSALGEYGQALDAYRRATELDPAFAFPWYGQAILLNLQPALEKGGEPSAKPCFCRAVYLHQTHVQMFPLPAALFLDAVEPFHLPLLAHRLFEEAGARAEPAADAARLARVARESEAPRRLLAALESDSSLDDRERNLLSGMICYYHGDPVRAFQRFDAVDSADETNLAAQYYLILSLRGYGEPVEKELAYALGLATGILGQAESSASVEQCYYAGRLFDLAGQTDKAAQCLARNGRHGPSLYARWFCLQQHDHPFAAPVLAEIGAEDVRVPACDFEAIDPARPGWTDEVRNWARALEIRPAVLAAVG